MARAAVLWTCSLALFFQVGSAWAQSMALPRDSTATASSYAPTAQPSARHALYVEWTTLGVLNSVGVTYEYRPWRVLAVSAGIGTGSLVLPWLPFFLGPFETSGTGGQFMAHALYGLTPANDGRSANSFEVALGLSAMRIDEQAPTAKPREWHVQPAAFLGYRFHPLNGGFVFRAGGGWSYLFGVGLSLSGGWAF